MKFGEQEIATELWYESLKLSQDAQAIAHWSSRHLAGETSISLHKIKEGGVIYVGTYFTDTVLKHLIPYLETVKAVKAPAFAGKPSQVEIVERESKTRRVRFYINHSDQCQELAWPENAGAALLDHLGNNGKLKLAPYDVALFEREI